MTQQNAYNKMLNVKGGYKTVCIVGFQLCEKIIFIEEDGKGVYQNIKSDHFWIVRLCVRVLFSCPHISTFFVSFTKRYDITTLKPAMLERTPTSWTTG